MTTHFLSEHGTVELPDAIGGVPVVSVDSNDGRTLLELPAEGRLVVTVESGVFTISAHTQDLAVRIALGHSQGPGYAVTTINHRLLPYGELQPEPGQVFGRRVPPSTDDIMAALIAMVPQS